MIKNYEHCKITCHFTLHSAGCPGEMKPNKAWAKHKYSLKAEHR